MVSILRVGYVFIFALALLGCLDSEEVAYAEEPNISKSKRSTKSDNSKKEQSETNRGVQIEARKKHYRNNWENYITAEHSNYNYSELGGISNLSIIVTNTTDYIIDNATVEVKILTVNGYVFKTFDLDFNAIEPQKRLEQYVPATNRGVSVSCKIKNLYSAGMDFNWNVYDNVGNGSLDDPWKIIY